MKYKFIPIAIFFCVLMYAPVNGQNKQDTNPANFQENKTGNKKYSKVDTANGQMECNNYILVPRAIQDSLYKYKSGICNLKSVLDSTKSADDFDGTYTMLSEKLQALNIFLQKKNIGAYKQKNKTSKKIKRHPAITETYVEEIEAYSLFYQNMIALKLALIERDKPTIAIALDTFCNELNIFMR